MPVVTLQTQLGLDTLAVTIAPLGDDPRATFGRLGETSVRYVQLSAAQPGLRPREMDRSARRGLAGALRRLELIVSGIDLWIPVDHFADPAHADRAVAATLETIEFAAEFRPCPIAMHLPVADDDHPQIDEMLELIAGQAEHHGVAIANFGASDPTGVDPAAQIALGHDPVATVFEIGANLTAARLADILPTGMRGPVGGPGGKLDLLPYRAALDAAGFGGPVTIDARQWTDPWAGVKQSVDAWRAIAPPA